MRTTPGAYNEDGSVKTAVYEWIYDTYCQVFGGCPELVEGVINANVLPTSGEADFNVNFDYLPEGMYDFYYCATPCFNGDFMSENYGYDGVTPLVSVGTNTDYNIGSNGGQILGMLYGWKYAQFSMMSESEQQDIGMEME